MLKKTLGLLSVLLIVLGVFALPLSAQDEQRWDGADDLEVNPLDCATGEGDEAAEGGEAEPAATEEAEGAEAAPAMEYDGGQPTDPPDLAGQPITVVDVPKLIGIGYFAATAQGMQEAAAELGNVTVTTDAPTEANIDEQITFIDNYITQGVDGILFAANDPVAIAPVLRRALEQGIHVIGYDANSIPEAREWFVNQAEFNGIAKSLIDNMVAEIGEDGSFGIVTSTFTTPNQARWIAEMWAYTTKCYPNLTWLETVEAQEDNILSFNQATTLINKYGEELDGIFGMTSVATPASAEAVTQAGLCPGQADEEAAVHVVGLATPNAMRPYVESGCVRSVVLWNPIDLGYAAVYVMRAVVDGELQPGDTSVEAGRLGTLQVVNGSEILLGPPFVYNLENIDEFDF
jgi:rhamnose transport system substrate-binding protein